MAGHKVKELPLRATKYVAGKRFQGDRLYEAGSPVSKAFIDSLPEHKIGQFLNQRILQPAGPTG